MAGRLKKEDTYTASGFRVDFASSRPVAPGPAITAPTTQRAWRALQVHHKDGPVRDASSKGGVEGAYLAPPLPVARGPA